MTEDANQARHDLTAAQRAHHAGQLKEAEALYRAILESDPQNAEVLSHLGALRGQRGRLVEAAELLAHAVALRPDSAAFHHNLAVTQQNLGDLASAKTSFEKVLSIEPNYAEALMGLGALLLAEGDLEGAESRLRKAIAQAPGHPTYHSNLASVLLAQHRNEEAAACFRTALEFKPDLGEAHAGLAMSLAQLGRLDEALENFEAARRLMPNNPLVLTNLGTVLYQDDRLDEAEAAYREALPFAENYPQTNIRLARLCLDREEPEEALALLETALSRRPNSLAAWAAKAEALDRLHRTEAADEVTTRFTAGVRIPPRFAELYAKMARRQGRAAEAVDRLQDLLDGAPLSPDESRRVHFTLGHLYDRLADFDQAFAQFVSANALRPGSFDPEAHVRDTEAILRAFSAERWAEAPRSETYSEVPVFIVGMPRSGTSLVEQVLACHPKVFGAGERQEIPKLAKALAARSKEPEDAVFIEPQQLTAAAEQHLDRLVALSGTAALVTDKMPLNHRYLGWIALLFPGARIIHCSRDPRDTCLSCYFQSFARGNFYASDLGHLGLYYRQYRKLMDHWKQHLPLPILEVRYEDHVADPERTAREMLAFLSLTWDPACLDFHLSGRAVRTLSRDQVRQPIYSSSVGRWRNYERHLGPLFDALGDAYQND